VADAPAVTPALPAAVGWVLGAPILVHALLLASLLSGVALLLGADASFSGDEGAAIIQAQHLAEGDGWLLPYELRSIDPSSERLFIALSELGPDGYAPYAKHPTYPLLLAGADRVGGAPAMVALSIAGAVAAAAAAAGLARRYHSVAAVPAFWAAGLATPLLFDSQAVLAHTLGAAAGGAATLAVVHLRERWRAVTAVAAVVAVALLAGLRTEGTLFALALGGVCVVIGWRDRRPPFAVVGVVLAGLGVAVLAVDRTVLGRITDGGAVFASPTAGEDDLFGGRARALVRTFLSPGSSWGTTSQLAVLALVGAAIVAAVAIRRRDPSRPLWTATVVLAGVGALGVLLAPQPDLIEGLFTTSPLLLAGLLLLDGDALRDRALSLPAATAALFTAGVLVTQYERGGAAEWGARFLAIELPILAALATIGFLRAAPRVPPELRRPSVVVLCVVALVSAAASVRALDHYKENARGWIEVTADAAASIEPTALDTGGVRPVVVSTWLSLGRMLWPLDDPPAGLYVTPDDLPLALDDLRSAGVEEVVLALPGGAEELALVEDRVELLDGFPTDAGPVWTVRLTD
jgi:hypothetical protein